MYEVIRWLLSRQIFTHTTSSQLVDNLRVQEMAKTTRSCDYVTKWLGSADLIKPVASQARDTWAAKTCFHALRKCWLLITIHNYYYYY